jgi:hypothetical protein
MRRTPFLFCFLSSFFVPCVRAQVPEYKISCYRFREQNPPQKQKLWDGYEVSLGPTRNSQGDGDNCTAAIYNAAGKVVFRTTGYSVLFDDINTGKDFDGDGKPEVVFKTDTGGGNHCCWAYNVVSLSPKPRKLFDIDQEGLVRFEKDADGKMVIWKFTGGPGGFTSEARRPFAQKVFRVRDAKLVDQTPEFCSQILSDADDEFREDSKQLTPENIKRLPAGTKWDYDLEDLVSAFLSRALQLVFCRQFDEAMKFLDQWPAASRAEMKKGFAQSIQQDYPEFAARLLSSSNTN